MRTRLLKALAHPSQALRHGWRLVRGGTLRLRHLANPRVKIGRNVLLEKQMWIRGPGRVTIGDDVFIDGTTHPVTLPTYSVEATITIGAGTYLNGTRFGCACRITVGANCILGDCRIMDTNHHSIYPGRRNDPALVRIAPVEIGDECWIGAGVFILPGTKIRSGSTVAAGSVVMGRFPPRAVIAGNPATMIMAVGNPPAGIEGGTSPA